MREREEGGEEERLRGRRERGKERETEISFLVKHKRLTCAMAHVERTAGAPPMRRGRMLRSWWEHEGRSVAAVVETLKRHSAGKKHRCFVAGGQVGSLVQFDYDLTFRQKAWTKTISPAW